MESVVSNMNIKKLIATLGISVSLLLLCGCQNNTNNQENTTITTTATTYAPDTTTKRQETTKKIEHYCQATGCTREGTKTYDGFGGTEYYCYTHYNELMDMIGNMEDIVGKGSASKHTCEICSKEGTHSIAGISGETEYYCTEHYNELLDMIASLYN